jgi:excisionase family DNA binding protein
MSAYATARHGRPSFVVRLDSPDSRDRPQESSPVPSGASRPKSKAVEASRLTDGVVELLIGRIAERIASAVAAQLAVVGNRDEDDWLDSRRAAEYLGVHRDTLRKLVAERTIPAGQDGPGCKLFFRRGHLDEWRRRGGRAAFLSSVVERTA